MVKRKRLKRGRLMSPSFQRISSEIKAPGEVGRAVPGDVQAQPAPSSLSPAIPAAKGRTAIYTYTTKPSADSFLLYQAESWVRMRLLLESVGPVAAGTRDDVSPPLSGKGILLPVDVEVTFPLSKGNRIFISSTAVNRVRVIIEPIPWAEQLTTIAGSMLGLLGGKR